MNAKALLPTVLFVIMGFGLQAKACPDLSGQYTCTSDDLTETESLVVTQETSPVLKVTVNGSEMLLDNKNYPMTGDPTLRNANIRSWCADNAVKSEVTGDFYDNDKKIGDIDTLTSYSLIGDSFIETVTGRIRNPAGETPLDNRLLCTRVKN